jgi:hypothetical protein
MTTDVLTRKTVAAIKGEALEGVYEAPGATDVIQIVGFSPPAPTIENLDRNLIKGTIGKQKPLKGLKAGTAEIVTELRAAGVTAGVSDEPEASLLFESALGRRKVGANATTALGSTATVIKLTAGGGAGFEKYDILLLDGEVRFIVGITGDDLTLNAPLTKGAPASGVAVKAGYTYKPASEGHKPFSLALFQDASTGGPTFKGIGCRVSSLALTDVTVGQIPKVTWTLELLTHAESIETSPGSPVFEPQNPPVVINGLAQRNDAVFGIATLEMTLENTISRQLDINAEGGTRRLHVTGRAVSGTVDPFLDQNTVTLQNAWRDNETFELFVLLGIRNALGDILQGTAVGIYLPSAIFTENGREDQDGLLKHALGYQAHEAEGGPGDDDVFIGFV